MALHARFLTQNILRVSKFKKLTHTTQAIDRTCEKNSVGFCAQTANAAAPPKEEKSREASTEFQLPPTSPHWSLHPWSLDHLVPACLPVCAEKLNPLRERSCSTTALSALSQDSLLPPSEAATKPVSYTTDDIMITTCPSDRHLWHGCLPRQGIVYENYPVTVVLTEERSGKKEALLNPASRKDTCSEAKEVGWESEDDGSVLYCPGSFPTHSVYDSFSSSNCQPYFSHNSSLPHSLFTDGSGESLAASAAAVSPAAAASVFSHDAVLHCAGMSAAPPSSGKGAEPRGPNMDQLKALESFFIETLPKFFKSRLDYRVYHPDVVFENNFWGENERTVGINQYALQMTKLRALTHLRYAHVHMEVVSSVCQLDEGRVRVQWRIVGLSQFKALRFWKYTAWSYGKAFREDSEWIDGISIFHVDKDGLVIKHRIDRMTPSEEQLAKESTGVGPKLALLFGLAVPKPSWSDCASLLCRR